MKFLRVTIVNGSPAKEDSNTAFVLSYLIKGMEQTGASIETIYTADLDIKPCIGCFKCGDTTPGICFQKDYGEEVAKKAINSDLLIFFTPLSWGGYSSELKKAIERMLGLLHPGFVRIDGSCRHKTRYDSYPSVLGVAVANKDNHDLEKEIFKELIHRHSLNWYTPQQKAIILDEDENEEGIKRTMMEVITQMEVNK